MRLILGQFPSQFECFYDNPLGPSRVTAGEDSIYLHGKIHRDCSRIGITGPDCYGLLTCGWSLHL